MDLYTIIPKNFFSPLASKNQEVYIACIMELFKVYEHGSILGIDRDIARQAIEDYLDTHILHEEIEDTESEKEITNRDRANQILRRLEECEWIDVDVTNDYDELINFRDYSITIIEALKDIGNDSIYADEHEDHEFRGYIYTVYTLLKNDYSEYGMVVEQVYRNTKAFIREIRKLDSRLKYYIRSIVDNAEIKDLITLLVNYKVELADQAYRRLKTSDNVNKYRTDIIKTLEDWQRDPLIMELIANEFMVNNSNNRDMAMIKANKRIDEMIDIYNSIDYIIDEIDNKNKIYINSTISKIKFLLSNDESVISKLTTILKYFTGEVKNRKTSKAMKTVEPLFNLKTNKQINNHSLYTPRGFYRRVESQYLVENNLGPGQKLQEAFYKEFERQYSEDVIYKYLDSYFQKNSVIKASQIINDDMSDEAVLRLLYILVYAGDEMDYYIKPLTNKIDHPKYRIIDFEIVRGQEL